MFNRRFYERIGINVQCVLFLQTGVVVEKNALLRDISESGIGLLIQDYADLEEQLCMGLPLQFQFEDTYHLFGEVKERIVSGEANVVRMAKTHEGFELGCILTRPDKVEDYVRERKIAQYLGSMQTFDS